MTWSPKQHDDHAITRFEGRPNEPFRDGEGSRWRRFLRAISSFVRPGGRWAKDGAGLAQEYAQAEVADRSNKASKTAAEAADLAASAEQKRAQTVVTQNEEIRRIFESDAPQEAKMLQLSNLLSKDPEIAKQIDNVGAVMEKLAYQRGVQVSIQPPRALTDKRTEEAEDDASIG